MTYQQFLEAAQTADFVAATAKLGTIRRGITWVGLRVGFVLFRLGFSANRVSLLGWLLGICGLSLVCFEGQLPHWYSGIAVACCYLGAFMDFCDGSVARARRSADKLGGIVDGIATDFIRSGFLVALGVLAGSAAFVIAGLVSGYVVVSLRNQFFWSGVLSADAQHSSPWISSTLRWAFSVHAMIAGLPLFSAIAAFLGYIQIFARIVLALYLVLSFAWFRLSCIGARKGVLNGSPAREQQAH
ncbi:MAG: CDP-alcohol phosphatidyltransferase family protein [Terracidiphilus sp.]